MEHEKIGVCKTQQSVLRACQMSPEANLILLGRHRLAADGQGWHICTGAHRNVHSAVGLMRAVALLSTLLSPLGFTVCQLLWQLTGSCQLKSESQILVKACCHNFPLKYQMQEQFRMSSKQLKTTTWWFCGFFLAFFF